MLIALSQLNATVGALEGNTEKIIDAARTAKARGAGLLVTPELMVTGYLPQDLVLKRHFISAQRDLVFGRLCMELALPALVGFIDNDENGHLYNSAAYIADGRVQHIVRKSLLPTYDVFDEWRYFRPGENLEPLAIDGHRVAVTICEDIWDDEYEIKVVRQLASAGADMIVNLSSSPYRQGKQRRRIELCSKHARETGLPLLYCNMVGGQDELIFDGSSIVVDRRGRLIATGESFGEDMLMIDPFADNPELEDTREHDGSAEIFRALCLGISDYFGKTGFEKAVLGLSGGIDSALVACLAAEALGPQNVTGVAMPSRFTADMSNSDAELLARNLGMPFHVFPIEESVALAERRFTDAMGQYRSGLTRENLQSRERGKILMEISNDRGSLVLATGNKTEYALGYSTLYGDMCGALAPIGDLSKPQVYQLSRWYNQWKGREVIPQRSIDREPSAELRAGQVDPFEYERTGPLVDEIIVRQRSRSELQGLGYPADEIDEAFRLIRLNEYKRWQAAPILRVTRKAFGSGRKIPLVNGFQE
ncbi:NAD+ synthase [bacterium]|nr:NAD+ synthase [bacterium]